MEREMKSILVALAVALLALSAPSTSMAAGQVSANKSNLLVLASVTPNLVKYGERATITTRTTRGAVCKGRISYPGRRANTGLGKRTVGANDTIDWTWKDTVKGATAGTVWVTCSLGKKHGSALFDFRMMK
jgi:hypothetical protein